MSPVALAARSPPATTALGGLDWEAILMDADTLSSLQSAIATGAALSQSDPEVFARCYCTDVSFAAFSGQEEPIKNAAAFLIQRFPDNADRAEPLLKLLGTRANANDFHDSLFAIDLIAVHLMTVDAVVAAGCQPLAANLRLPGAATRRVIKLIRSGKSNDQIADATKKTADAVRRLRSDYEAGQFDLSWLKS